MVFFSLFLQKLCSKVQHILQVWNAGHGVISLHCFQNVIVLEAYTREACMVDAIGKEMLRWAAGIVLNVLCSTNFHLNVCIVSSSPFDLLIGLKMLTNQKRGDYYGVVSTWPVLRKRELGVHLLYRAMQIFLAEGEWQLWPADIRWTIDTVALQKQYRN